ncbi:MAG: hypothetical protein AB1411_11575 [Nitrospirota bacterium]
MPHALLTEQVAPSDRRKCWGLVLIIVLFIVGGVLLLRAVQEERWSGWMFGDAQTLLTIRHWQKDGVWAHYGLFLPQGYSVATRFLEEPPLRHHAHGTSPASSPNVGPRLHYTHYPSGYLFPFAAVMKAGWDQAAAFRAVSLTISLVAVWLMYLVFSRILSPAIGWFAAIYYLTSSMFLEYADSLANQPLDDFLRFLFMWITLKELQVETPTQHKVYMGLAWIIWFSLALSSYDSVLFLLIWMVGLDLMTGRGVRLGRWVSMVSAPALAFTCQLMQNIWYLGAHDAYRDIMDTFLGGSIAQPQRRILVMWGEMVSMVGRSVVLKIVLGPVLFLLGWLYVRGNSREAKAFLRYLFLLSIAGCTFSLVLVTAGGMFYQGRQFAPLISLLVGGLTVWCMDLLLRPRWPSLSVFRTTSLPKGVMVLLLATVALLWSGSIWASVGKLDIPPRTTGLTSEDLSLAKALKEVADCDRVIFTTQGFTDFINPTYVPGYPQIHPIHEFLSDALILSFDSSETLAKDLLWLWQRSEFQFVPILVSRSNREIQTVSQAVLTKLDVQQIPPRPRLVHGRYVLALSHVVSCSALR